MQGLLERGVVAGWKMRGTLFCNVYGAHPQSRRMVFSLRRDGASHASVAANTSGDQNSGQSSSSQGNKYLLSGATIATLLMLGGLHARRLYDDKKSEQARQQGIEPEFHPDLKAAFLQILPLRFFSRLFGTMTSVELPIWSRSYIFRSYARAFHANLEEVAEKLDDYASLQSFFTRKLKEGCRPIDSSSCVISPVDGVILRCGEVSTRGRAIEQVKGYSYSLKALLGGQPHNLLTSTSSNMISADEGSSTSSAELEGCDLFYCVLYLGPGDYHRVHSPVDWHILSRRHISGRLFPVNERATRTIGSLYTGNERVLRDNSLLDANMLNSSSRKVFISGCADTIISI
ncbi:hypothetical protein KP509_03G034100 [Ceratopteris richardii]|uniref:phosphatidylserine decarboxylase n=1 Tax=Ceratopteris richardii TaxID=49495 RepID=A0A8T2UYT5_CERRI|nr:hypothetical protein KP509_03G034100 [Ceratopteris richardii]